MAIPTRRVASAVIVVLTLTAAAYGGGRSGVAAATVPAGRWTVTLCTNLERYGKAAKRPFLVFQGLHLEFTYGVPKQSDVRTKQLNASAAIVDATDQLIADTQAAGVPKTAHGRPFADEFVSALRELRDSVADVHDKASSLPTGTGRVHKGRRAVTADRCGARAAGEAAPGRQGGEGHRPGSQLR